MSKVVLQVEDCAFEAPRDVRDQEFQGFLYDSRVVNFQCIYSPSSTDSSSESDRIVQSVAPLLCFATQVAFQRAALSSAFRAVQAFPTVNRWCKSSQHMQRHRLDLFLVSYK